MDNERLLKALGDPGLRWILDRVKTRLERNVPLTGPVSHSSPSDVERRALARLLGRRPSRGGSISVRLEALDEIVRRAELAPSLADAVVALSGPLDTSSEDAARAEAEWRRAFDEARRSVRPGSPLVEWVTEVEKLGVVKRLCRGEAEAGRRALAAALSVAAALPAEGVPLAEFAASLLGDSHALDHGAPVGTLAFRAVEVVVGPLEVEPADRRRAVWAAVGVLCDELSAPALVLNLRASGDGLSAKALDLHAEQGEPYRLSVRQLLRERVAFSRESTGEVVHVCENPSVVAAAASRLGPRSAPLISTEGVPKTAVRLVLDRLRAAGVEVVYHGDFDWPGLRIGNLIVRRHGARPWRFDAGAYDSARGGPSLSGARVEAIWDPALAESMERRGAVVHEEEVREGLLQDLG